MVQGRLFRGSQENSPEGVGIIGKIIPRDLVPIELSTQVRFEFQQGWRYYFFYSLAFS